MLFSHKRNMNKMMKQTQEKKYQPKIELQVEERMVKVPTKVSQNQIVLFGKNVSKNGKTYLQKQAFLYRVRKVQGQNVYDFLQLTGADMGKLFENVVPTKDNDTAIGLGTYEFKFGDYVVPNQGIKSVSGEIISNKIAIQEDNLISVDFLTDYVCVENDHANQLAWQQIEEQER